MSDAPPDSPEPPEPKGFSLANSETFNATPVRMRCPFCRHMGTFEPILNVHDARTFLTSSVVGGMGVRRCPNSECLKGVFVVATGETAVAAYPPEVLDVDTTNLRKEVLEALEEAVKCHSIGCYRASAIMVRRTVEVACDQQGATGSTLQQRLKNLGSKAVMPVELLDGLDDLRLLGNDAAHVELKDYDDVGQEEVELAIGVVKMLLLALYQTSNLVERLRAKKKQTLS